MAGIATILSSALDRQFELLGVDATYTPSGGDPVSVTVIPSQSDEIQGLPTGSRAQVETNLFDLRAAEVASPAAEDTLTVASTTYDVVRAQAVDPRRLIWKLEVRPQ